MEGKMVETMKRSFLKTFLNKKKPKYKTNTLIHANYNKPYVIKKIQTNQEDLKNFLFTLGCYEGEKITLISVLSDTFTIVIKDARYSIDRELAEAIIIE